MDIGGWVDCPTVLKYFKMHMRACRATTGTHKANDLTFLHNITNFDDEILVMSIS